MSDRWNAQAQLEHLQQKYVGAGNADTSKWEWGCSIKRDSYASHIGHHPRLLFMSLVENESIARTKLQFLTKMIQPCGPPDNN
ncbi:hypothetical protein SteCoe_11684 [Stentor coeruleus]|uniref:Splicing factor subunit n=1 Tax=Stentor coeruleus TaxID=5963 RepID=A0A1R2CCK8_9CILI|nr:hypothetical protein SteCoe_11684 [Stentor coeruleus]